MVSEKFLVKVKDKFVHVDFYDSEGNNDWVEGILDYNCDEETGEYTIEITSNTDLDRIALEDIKKIYLKDEKEVS